MWKETEFLRWLKTQEVSQSFLAWAYMQPEATMESVWNTCQRGDWMLQVLRCLEIPYPEKVMYRSVNRALICSYKVLSLAEVGSELGRVVVEDQSSCRNALIQLKNYLDLVDKRLIKAIPTAVGSRAVLLNARRVLENVSSTTIAAITGRDALFYSCLCAEYAGDSNFVGELRIFAEDLRELMPCPEIKPD